MKERILKNWTALRVMYVAMGGVIIAGAIAEHQWLGTLFGAYFAAMGIFSFGCAAGNCGYIPLSRSKFTNSLPPQLPDATYEEVK